MLLVEEALDAHKRQQPRELVLVGVARLLGAPRLNFLLDTFDEQVVCGARSAGEGRGASAAGPGETTAALLPDLT